MGRMVIVKSDNEHGVSCIPMWRPLEHYNKRYEVLCIINKPHNYYHVKRIKEYFKKKGVMHNG